ncbi:CPBP family intramembrane glutamic endopeptidase [Qipengyuania qiaonensis]|uniref:CPBP family intramembrane metalloprotease n=1 Tax=Qipengyuania qiaonensis TaxID=2867240 RepID=A0ABS7J1W1_9SPHN|nr:CPBP family intramembrane glutamic endopeptidase [Qipengyuania qiaonensis]MBX7481327.1 CPBP family intramembrane metalloprotease [Qipengyuania qiaonensis]
MTETTRELPRWKIAAAMIVQAMAFVSLGLALWYLAGRDATNFVSPSVKSFLLGLLVGLGLIAVFAVLWRKFPHTGEKLVRVQAPTYRFLGRDLTWPIVVLISLSAGIGEEALFRGGLQTWLGTHVTMSLAIVLAALAFAVLHGAKLFVAGLIFLIGSLFGLLYWQTGDLLAMMVGHAVYDVWALLFLNREMHRLGLFDEVDRGTAQEGATILAKCDAAG